MSGENVKTDQASNQDPGAWGNFDNFAGERNINDKTGKGRTFSEFDVYPPAQIELPDGSKRYETHKEYGERLKYMHQKTAEYLAEQAAKEEASKAITNAQGSRTEDYLKSDFGKKELDAEANYGRVADKLAHYVQEGKMTKDHADKLLERKFNSTIEEIDGIRQDFKDSKTGDQEAYEKWLEERGFKEKPKAKEVIVAEDKPAEEAPENKDAMKDTKELGTDDKNVVDEAKERLMKELEPKLGPIIYDSVMAIVAGEIDRIFSEIKPAQRPTVEDEPKITAPEGDSEKLLSESDLIGAINDERVKRGDSSLTVDTDEELKNIQQERIKAEATAKDNLAKVNKDREKQGKAPLNLGEIQLELDKNQQEMANRILNKIKIHSDQIGGQKGIDILTNSNMKDPESYSEWWNSLDAAGQKTIRRILENGKEFDYVGINQNFVNWLHDEVNRGPKLEDNSKAA